MSTPPVAPHRSRRVPAVRLNRRSQIVLGIVCIISVAVFGWPLIIAPTSAIAGHANVPLLFAALLPLVLAVAMTEIADGGLDAKAIAMLGVLTALGAALRPLGTGIAGIEPIFFLLVLAGRVFGPGFGFLLGCLTLLASALVTGGVGPWLPYQMLAAAGVAIGAGLLPRAEGRREILMLAAYGAVAGIAYGLAMNLSFWPFTVGEASELSYIAGAPILDNLQRFAVFSVLTSLAFDIPRALLMVVLIVITGPALLRTFRRAARKAVFDATPTFVASDDATTTGSPRAPSPGAATTASSDKRARPSSGADERG
ncbi:MAG: ECF transporter S component [Nitriliruptoraceae bacterium]